jgi:hypothetical protein
MKVIETILSLFPEEQQCIRIENDPYMTLVIERIGLGPNGKPSISVAHYYEQNGDLMRDPEMTFEQGGLGWVPLSFTQDGLGLYQEAIWKDEESGSVLIRTRLFKQLQSFARTWSSNLRAQGFIKAAKAKAHSRATA